MRFATDGAHLCTLHRPLLSAHARFAQRVLPCGLKYDRARQAFEAEGEHDERNEAIGHPVASQISREMTEGCRTAV